MHASVLLETHDGRSHELVHGDVIGRLWSAALQLDDARISEAHALVSLRGSDLRLLALRGGLAVDNKPCREVALQPDLEVALAPGVVLRVIDVRLPSAVLGIEGDRLPRRTLPPVCSILEDDPPRIRSRWDDSAAVHVWSTGAGWRVRRAGGEPQPLEAGAVLNVGAHALRIVSIPLASAGAEPTRVAATRSLRVVANFDTVHVHRAQAEPLVVGGVQARIVSELVALDGPVAWTVLVDLVWPRETERALLRTRLDVHLSRLRRKLRAADIRPDLVRSDGAGNIELLLYPGDEIVDRT